MPEITAPAPKTEPQGEILVCTDCFVAAVNGEVNPEADPAPWALDPEIDVTPGSLAPHDHPEDADCFCDEPHFSWSSCQGCGSTLGGDRHPMVWWA